jgi:hypothetical protein
MGEGESHGLGSVVEDMRLRRAVGDTCATDACEAPSNLNSIGKNAFKDAAQLSAMTLPAGVTILGGAFTGAPTGVVHASSYTIDGVASSCPAGATLS